MKQMTIEQVREQIELKKGIPHIDKWPDANIDGKTSYFQGDLTKSVDGIPMVDYARQLGDQFLFPHSSSLLLMMGFWMPSPPLNGS